MGLEPLELMQKMEQRMLFNHKDKAVLQTHADWGQEIAPAMALAVCSAAEWSLSGAPKGSS